MALSEGEEALLTAMAASGAAGAAMTADDLAAEGVPTRRDEAWRWSDLRAAITPDLCFPKGDPEAFEETWIANGDDVIGALAHGFGRRRRSVVRVGEPTLIIERVGQSGFDAKSRDIVVEPGAEATCVVVQSGGDVALFSANVIVQAGGRYRQAIIADGARLARIETFVDVAGEGADVELNGAYLCGSGRHADLTSVIEHKAGGGTTRQLIKGVARKGGRGVFQGRIVVDRGAQKTDARQYHHGILLEEGAEIFAKPELMIHADDVQCAHGNTAGGLDERALFYMRSRGLPEPDARAMLIEAFLVEAIPEGLDAAIRDELTGRIAAWLREARP
jgi:Fe-S cluster assembly protein SufD